MRSRALVCLFACVAASAMADETATQSLTADETKSDKSLLEVIVIQAERDDTTLKEATRSVVVFTEDQLRLGTDRTMTDVFQRVPNVTTDPFFYRTDLPRDRVRCGIQRGLARISADQRVVRRWLLHAVAVEPVGRAPGGGATRARRTSSPEARWAASTSRPPTTQPSARRSRRGELGAGLPMSVSWDSRMAGRCPAISATAFRLWAHDRRLLDEFSDRRATIGILRMNTWPRLKLVWQPFDDADTIVRLRAEARKVSIDGDKDVQAPNASFDPFDRTDFSNSPSRDQDEAAIGLRRSRPPLR